MSTPHDVLGLEPGADRKAIKRAYASLLKQHRPDQDPERFRRIRDAYEWLIARTAESAAKEPAEAEAGIPPASPPISTSLDKRRPDPSSDVSPIVVAAALPTPVLSVAEPREHLPAIDRSAPNTWELRVAELAVAAAQPAGTARDAAVLTAVQALNDLVRAHPGGEAAWSQALMRHLGNEAALLARATTDEDLAREAMDGPGWVARLVCEERFRARDWERLRTLAQRWLMRLDECAHLSTNALGLTRHLALCLAVVDYPLTTRLSEHLQRQGGGRVRMPNDPELDTSLLMGSALRAFPEDLRIYIDRTLFTPMHWWDEPALYRRAYKLLRALPADSPLRGWLRGRAPHLYNFLGVTQGTSMRLTLLGVLLYLFAFVVTFAGLIAIVARPDTDINPWWMVAAMGTLGLGAFVAAWWLNRRLENWFYQRIWAPIDRQAGPFDFIFCLWTFWVLFGASAAPLTTWRPDGRWSVPLWFALPILLAVPFARLRRFLAPAHGRESWRRLLPEPELLQRFRQLLGNASYDVGAVLASLVRGLPALVLSTAVLAGLVLNPALQWSDYMGGLSTWTFWAGPALALGVSCHAWMLTWWQSAPRRWGALAYWVGWCIAAPPTLWGLGMLAMRYASAWQPLPALAVLSTLVGFVWIACRRAP